MKLVVLAAAAAVSVAGVTGASAQVYVAEPYAAQAYVPAPAYAAPLYAAPAPVIAAPAPVIVEQEPVYLAPPAIGGYVPPKYSYTITTPPHGVVYAGSRALRGCALGPDGYCY